MKKIINKNIVMDTNQPNKKSNEIIEKIVGDLINETSSEVKDILKELDELEDKKNDRYKKFNN